jgi:hypothetical protein
MFAYIPGARLAFHVLPTAAFADLARRPIACSLRWLKSMMGNSECFFRPQAFLLLPYSAMGWTGILDTTLSLRWLVQDAGKAPHHVLFTHPLSLPHQI